MNEACGTTTHLGRIESEYEYRRKRLSTSTESINRRNGRRHRERRFEVPFAAARCRSPVDVIVIIMQLDHTYAKIIKTENT